MGNVQQVFRDITEDGNVWDQESLVLPCHKDVLSEDALPLPSLFLAPGASLKTSASRSTLGSESFSESEDGFGNFDLTPQKVVLQSTGLFTSWEVSPSRRGRWHPVSCRQVLLSEARLRQLRPHLPMRCRLASAWRLLYCPAIHGVSIGTFFRQCQAWPGETLLLMEDTQGKIFGGFASQTWQVAQRQHFGQPDCFVFSFQDGALELHSWAGENRYFLFADSSGLKLGGGRSPAIWVDQDFLKGASGPCETFGTSRPLSSAEFVLRRFECWGFDCYDQPKEDSQRSVREISWEAVEGQRQMLR